MICSSCGESVSYVVINGFSTYVCIACAEATIVDANIIVRLDSGLWNDYDKTQSNFIAVAAAMQKISQNWSIIAPKVF
jgi:hypothetical protein